MNASHFSAESTLENNLLAHLDRFGMTVVEAVARLRAFVDWPKADVQQFLDQLEASGAIGSNWLYCNRRYYFKPNAKEDDRGPQVTHRKAQSVHPRADLKNLSEESKIRRFAMLSFCCLGRTPRLRLTEAELRLHFDQPHSGRLATNYYLQTPPSSVLGYLRVDMGGHGRWDRVLAKCLQDAREHERAPGWRATIDSGRFEITLVTTLPQKADRLRRALVDLPSPPRVPIRISAIPELLYLIAPPPV